MNLAQQVEDQTGPRLGAPQGGRGAALRLTCSKSCPVPNHCSEPVRITPGRLGKALPPGHINTSVTRPLAKCERVCGTQMPGGTLCVLAAHSDMHQQAWGLTYDDDVDCLRNSLPHNCLSRVLRVGSGPERPCLFLECSPP